MQNWSLQEAKNKLSEVVDRACGEGPQLITKRGVPHAVVISFADWQKLACSREKMSEFFRRSPLVGVDLDLERDRSPARERVAL